MNGSEIEDGVDSDEVFGFVDCEMKLRICILSYRKEREEIDVATVKQMKLGIRVPASVVADNLRGVSWNQNL